MAFRSQWPDSDRYRRGDGHRRGDRKTPRRSRRHRCSGGPRQERRGPSRRRRFPTSSFGVQVDVTSSASVNAAVAAVLQRTGRVHILVNNAGMAGKAAPVGESERRRFHESHGHQRKRRVLFCRAVMAHMREHKYGRIVNIASIAGKEGNPNMIAYSGSKAAVIGMTKSLGKEVATEGICVNAVCAGGGADEDSRAVDAAADRLHDR